MQALDSTAAPMADRTAAMDPFAGDGGWVLGCEAALPYLVGFADADMDLAAPGDQALY